MDCQEFTDLLPLYLEDGLDASRREQWRAHLESCAECSTRAMEKDPTFLFLTGAPSTIDTEGVERCVDDLGALIRHERFRRRIRRPQRWWYAAAAAMLLMISASFFWARTDAPISLLAASETQPTVGAEINDQSQPPRMDVEMSHKGLRVYQFANTGDGNSAAYFIVDEDLES
jgi:anti-sigma factor RsiW